MEKKSQSNKVIRFYKNQVDRLRLKVSKAFAEHQSTVEAKLRFIYNYGYDSEILKEREIQAYLKACDLYLKLHILVQKYFEVKGVEGVVCQEESR